ncbi:MAG: penicillin-binding transpeptidase domain-containing protein [Clostridiales bacterium]|nr:penicillin-binding transpeptidase domain-containing protein [Clostridiales bacterium]
MATTHRRRRKRKKFNNRMRATLICIMMIVVLLFVALIIRIRYIQVRDGSKYEKRVLSQQSYVSSSIPYQRGSILDRNGTVLAKSSKVYNVVLDVKVICSDETYLAPTKQALMTCFDISSQDIDKLIAEKEDSRYAILVKGVSKEKKEAFEALEEKQKEEGTIQGVWFETDYKRVYPKKSLGCDVIGFYTNGTSTGIESNYNEELSGTDGREYGYFDSNLKLQRTLKSAENGNNLITTIDATIQSAVEKKVAKFNKETGSKETAVVVMNPQNGEILAMTSGQQYDLNDPWSLDGLYTKEEQEKMSEKDRTDALNAMWRNYCISDGYEPGSTFKPVTVAAALEEGVAADKSTFNCIGYEKIKNVSKPIKCVSYSHGGHGVITLEQSLMKSCNSAMMQLVEKMGKGEFYRYQKIFGFGSKTGVDLPAETPGIIYSEDRLGPADLATSSFGQTFNVNMLQIASAISSLINGGNYYEPHVVQEIRNDDGATVKTIDPVLVRKTVSGKTSDLIRKYMLATVEEGTGNAAHIDGYQIGGKTGTAEKYPRGNRKYLVSFIGFAPYDEPQVVVYVVVDEPAVDDQAHSTYASGICHDVMKEILPYMGIEKTATEETTSESGTE